MPTRGTRFGDTVWVRVNLACGTDPVNGTSADRRRSDRRDAGEEFVQNLCGRRSEIEAWVEHDQQFPADEIGQ